MTANNVRSVGFHVLGGLSNIQTPMGQCINRVCFTYVGFNAIEQTFRADKGSGAQFASCRPQGVRMPWMLSHFHTVLFYVSGE